MSSNIPTRRLTRATRLPDENAVKGRVPLLRGTTRSATAAAAASALSKPTTSGVASDANLQHKRKREALGEVTNNDKNKNPQKDISRDSKTAKPLRLTTKAGARKPCPTSTLPSTSKEAEKLEQEQHEGEDEYVDAMIVDEPVVEPDLVLHRVTRRLTTRTSTIAASVPAVRRPTKNGDEVPAPDLSHAGNVGKGQVDDEDTHRAIKRRRTSSEADVEAVVETQADVDASLVEDGVVSNHKHKVDPSLSQEEDEEAVDWDDLDKDDFDDPYMVSEYVVDIFKYLSECEAQTLPNPNYMQHQAELKWSHRSILMDYLVGLHHKSRMLPETLYLTVNIIDRFLSMRVVSLSKLQLVGLSCLLIASKFEEICSPSMANLLDQGAPQDYSKAEDMLKAERYILRTLNWSVSLYPQPMNWLRRISKADDYDPEVRALAKFFLEIHVLEKKMLGIKPSLIAAASIWLGRLVLNHFGWSPNLAHYSGYSEKLIIPVANIMLNFCLRSDRPDNFTRKYESKKYSKVGVFIHNWVTSRWTTGDTISLIDELPYLKALAAEKD